MYGIVKQSGGDIQLYSEEGQGTTFKIYLPRTQETPQVWTRPQAREELPAGTETILLVEDDEEVRGLARRVLEIQGYQLLEARTAEEGLRRAAGHAGPIHLLLTDVVLPGLGGKALAEQLLTVRPGLKVIYMSGYTDNAIAHRGVLERGVRFLQKPFSPGKLIRQVRRELDR